jgi:hypothetical protein
MMTREQAKYAIQECYLLMTKTQPITELTPMEFYLYLKKNRPDLLEYERRADTDPYQDVKAWVWKYVQPHLSPPDK